jgi:uncharacterized repeat protein (TIGR03803 family)
MKIRMKGQDQSAASACDISLSPLAVGLFLMMLSAAIVMAAPLAQAQTFQVLHAFTGGGDDAAAYAGLTVDAAGNFYGTTSGAGIGSNGSVFKLASAGSGWLLKPLKNFGRSGNGPSEPFGNLTIGPDGALYGTTFAGGSGGGGTVFKLQPPAHACASFSCPWTLTVLHDFNGSDGAGPIGGVVFDRAGNLYGTTFAGGALSCTDNSNGCGVVYELSPSGGGWTETVIYDFNFGNDSDGAGPSGGLIFDTVGNLYGVTFSGGNQTNGGIVYKLSPSQGGGWTQTILHLFSDPPDGSLPIGTLIMDRSGNLYGTTQAGGTVDGGTVFELSQQGEQVLYNFPENSYPAGTLVFDGSGNLYGATWYGGVNGYGTVFKLAPAHGSWNESDLHVFQASDGIVPNGGIALDSAGDLYGTAQKGGYFSDVCMQGCGTVWKIAP